MVRKLCCRSSGASSRCSPRKLEMTSESIAPVVPCNEEMPFVVLMIARDCDVRE